MPGWTVIPDADIDPKSPITTLLLAALRDNPAAVAEGGAGAPRVMAGALKPLSEAITMGTAESKMLTALVGTVNNPNTTVWQTATRSTWVSSNLSALICNPFSFTITVKVSVYVNMNADDTPQIRLMKDGTTQLDLKYSAGFNTWLWYDFATFTVAPGESMSALLQAYIASGTGTDIIYASSMKLDVTRGA